MEARADQAWSDAVHPDAERADLLGKRADEGRDRALARGVVRGAEAAALEGSERGHQHDRPGAARLHRAEHGLGGEEGAEDVDVEGLPPERERGVDAALALEDAAGVGEEDVDRAELGLGAGDHLGDPFRIADVGREAERARMVALDRAGVILAREIGEGDLRAGLGEGARRRAADPRGAAGDENDLVCEFHASPLSVGRVSAGLAGFEAPRHARAPAGA